MATENPASCTFLTHIDGCVASAVGGGATTSAVNVTGTLNGGVANADSVGTHSRAVIPIVANVLKSLCAGVHADLEVDRQRLSKKPRAES